jgi:hypothetical protein
MVIRGQHAVDTDAQLAERRLPKASLAPSRTDEGAKAIADTNRCERGFKMPGPYHRGVTLSTGGRCTAGVAVGLIASHACVEKTATTTLAPFKGSGIRGGSCGIGYSVRRKGSGGLRSLWLSRNVSCVVLNVLNERINIVC